jgi:epoxyqueuosine reductase
MVLEGMQEQLTALAQKAGFDLAGVVALEADAASDASEPYLEQWIASGHAGEMEYLKRRNDDDQLLRSSIQAAFPWARSVVVCAANYNSAAPTSIDPAPQNAGWIARYALSGTLDESGATETPTDYHDVLLQRLRSLEGELKNWLGFEQSRSYVDTGPIIERSYANLAGIGWTGKNTCIINQQLGSWLFLGVIVTSYAVPGNEQRPTLPPDRCGTCRRCIEACPTDALIAPYEMDASRCIAYLTIEKRGSIDEPLRAQMGRQVFGCDICQDVCPWNRRAPISQSPDFAARPELVNPQLSFLAELDAQAFNKLFKGSPVKRTKISGLLRNVAIAMGNSGDRQHLEKLASWTEAADPALRESASWAVNQIEKSGKQKGPPAEGGPDPNL